MPDKPWRQLWSTLRGRRSVLRDRPFVISKILLQATSNVEQRLVCFALALGLTLAIGLAGTALLARQEDALVLVRHFWGAIGALLGVTLTVAVTRSELRAIVLLLVGGVLTGLASIVTSWSAIIPWFSPQGQVAHGGYFVIGTALGIALGSRAVIAYQRAPSVAPKGLGAVARGLGLIVVAVTIATFAIYWLSQKTTPGDPSSNAIVTALLAAITVGFIYHFVAPPPPSAELSAAWKRLVPRAIPIAAMGPIAAWMIARKTGDHSLPYWVDGLAVGCLAGVFLGYLVDLIERPFAGRCRATAAMTIIVVIIAPALRLLAFHHTSATGIIAAWIGASFGLIVGVGLTFALVRIPDHQMVEPDPPDLEPTRHVVLFVASSPIGLPPIEVYREARAIRLALMGARHAQAFDFELRVAAQFVDLEQALTELAPTVVHLSGHGDEHRFYFHAADNLPMPVPREAIANAFRISGSSVKIAVVNACKSAQLAEDLLTTIDFTIGMTEEFNDRSACAFAEGFYRALGNGKAAAAAYLLGKNEILARQLPHADVPRSRAGDPEHSGALTLGSTQ